jgi:hypothetical protein
VPKDGLHAPREAKGSVIRTVGPTNVALANPTAAKSVDQRQGAAATPKPAGIRISSALGEVKLNVGNATHGLAHGAVPPGGRNGSHKNTIWSDTKGAVAGHGGGNSSTGTGTDSMSPAANSAAIAAAVGSANAPGNLAGTGSSYSAGGGGNSGNSGNSGNGKNADQGNGKGNGANYWDAWATYLEGKTHGNGHGPGHGNNGNGNENGNGNGNGKK